MKDNKFFGKLELKTKDKFIVNFPEELGINTYIVYELSEIVYYPQGNKWGDICISLYNPVGPSTEQAIYKNIIGKNIFNIGLINLIQLDVCSEEIGKFEILESTINEISFDRLSWKDNSTITTKIVISPSNIKIIY